MPINDSLKINLSTDITVLLDRRVLSNFLLSQEIIADLPVSDILRPLATAYISGWMACTDYCREPFLPMAFSRLCP